MRTVATLLLVLAALSASLPVQAETADAPGANECRPPEEWATTRNVCLDLNPAALGSPVPANAHYYLWIGAGECASGSVSDCRGTPAAQGSTAGVFGILYQESNILGGLQREAINVPQFVPADKMVLI